MTLDASTIDVRRFAGPHKFRCFDAANGSDIDPDPTSQLIVSSQIRQDVSGRHRREAGDPATHVDPSARVRSMLASPHGADAPASSLNASEPLDAPPRA